MRIFYLPVARDEYERKLKRIALRPFTTHSITDFLDDMTYLEDQICAHPGLRPAAGAPPGFFRVGPSPTYSYHLIYRLRDGNAYIMPWLGQVADRVIGSGEKINSVRSDFAFARAVQKLQCRDCHSTQS